MPSRFAGWGCAVVLVTCSLWSQEPSSSKGLRLSADVYAGYSLVSPNFGAKLLGGPAENGGTAGADLHVTPSIAVATEADWMSVVYGSQLSSSEFTILAGPRVFLPSSSRARLRFLADGLVGVVDMNRLTGVNSPFTGTTALAIAADGGVELRAIGPLALRVEGGYLHSGFTARYPDIDPQSSMHNQHGRLLIEGVWHF